MIKFGVFCLWGLLSLRGLLSRGLLSFSPRLRYWLRNKDYFKPIIKGQILLRLYGKLSMTIPELSYTGHIMTIYLPKKVKRYLQSFLVLPDLPYPSIRQYPLLSISRGSTNPKKTSELPTVIDFRDCATSWPEIHLLKSSRLNYIID